MDHVPPMEPRWWERPLNDWHHSDDAGYFWIDFAAQHEFSEEEIAVGCGPSEELTLRSVLFALWECSVAEL